MILFCMVIMMKKINIKNGIKLIYEKRKNYITSFCIGFNAGALMENKDELGLAHVVEHMIFKGTNKRDEMQINMALDEVFGFNNAMTNFPYSIYYGTTLSEDFEKGFEIYSDIILNPTFPIKGFKEEIDIICEELREWKDDNFQLCEDEMLNNAFEHRRIKTCIIGEEVNIRTFTVEDIKRFYNKFYTPRNCTISVVSSLDFDEVQSIVNKYFENWNTKNFEIKKDFYEKNKAGKFVKKTAGIQGAKIQYCFPIDKLDHKEITALKIFNLKFGEGTSSILYDKIRTENGLAYDVYSYIKNEAGIKLFTICMGTAKENVDKAIEITNNLIFNIDKIKATFTENEIKNVVNRLKLKRELKIERSIELSKELTTSEIMYGHQENFNEQEILGKVGLEEIYGVIDKVLVSPTIQVLC